MDAYTRFGLSLYLAGAASALGDQRGLTPDAERSVLSQALRLIGHSKVMVESFLAKYDDNMEAKKNRDLISAGETAMIRHLHSSDGSAKTLGSIIEQWKKPRLSPTFILGDVFLLTYAVMPQSNNPIGLADDPMDRHNRRIRKVLSDCDGEEVRHTGKGIFARFKLPDDAICAAIAIQQDWDRLRKSEAPPPPTCVAIVGSSPGDGDPAVSGETFSQADILCRRLGESQVACDTLVRDNCTIQDIRFGTQIPNAHSGISEKVNAFRKILWDLLPT